MSRTSENIILSARGISKRLGGRLVLDKTTLEISESETIQLSGANGCGKSTLLACLAGIEDYFSGEILYKSSPVGSKVSWATVRKSIGYVKADCSMLYGDLTLRESLRLVDSLRGENQGRISSDSLQGIVQRLGLDRYMDTAIGNLSFGTKKKASILVSCSGSRKELLLLDEPFEGLDEDSCLTLEAILQNELSHIAKVIVSHRYLNIKTSRKLILQSGILVEEKGRDNVC